MAETANTSHQPETHSPDNLTSRLAADVGALIEAAGDVATGNQSSHFLRLPLEQIHPSSTNPRKSFEGPDFDELVSDVRRRGVLVPVLVRLLVRPRRM